MKLSYTMPKGKRTKKDKLGIFCTSKKLWYSFEANSWQIGMKAEITEKGISTHQPCKSIRAFRRKLKQAPNGFTFCLISEQRGDEVYGIGTKSNSK